MKNYDIFISYRREGGEHVAKIIRDRLHDLGYRVFFDVESLRSGNFNEKLYSVIEECKDFVLVLSPNALERCKDEEDWVRKEVEHALSCGKNVVPILLRGFVFSGELPEKMKVLPQMNGIEATTEFFDAFVEKLQTFLVTKPNLKNRIQQNVVLRKMLPFLLALLVAAAVGAGIWAVVSQFSDRYPRSQAEQNLTDEVIYYAGIHLTNMNIVAIAAESGLDAAERYLLTGQKESVEFQDSMAVAMHAIENVDETLGAYEADLATRIEKSPFEGADLKALHEETATFKKEWLGNLAYVSYVASPELFLSDSEKLEIIECYRTILEETMKVYAGGANELFLPVTEQIAMEPFFGEILPYLSATPLSEADWKTEEDEIAHGVEAAFTNIEAELQQLSTIVGNTSMENAQMKEALIRYYVSAGYTQEEAEVLIEEFLLQK